MNHLTNLYKHKCEQLQEQINNIKRMLNEAEAPGPVQFPPEWHPPLLAPQDFQVPLERPQSTPTKPDWDGTTRPPSNPQEGDLWADKYRNVYMWKNGQWVLVQQGERSPREIPYGTPYYSPPVNRPPGYDRGQPYP
jgi:hypothetical protein